MIAPERKGTEGHDARTVLKQRAPLPPPAPPMPSKVDDIDFFPVDLPGLPAHPEMALRHVPTTRLSRRKYLSSAQLNPRDFYHPIGAATFLLLTEMMAMDGTLIVIALLFSQLPASWGVGVSMTELNHVLAMGTVLPVANLIAGLIPGYGLGPVKSLRLRTLVALTLLVPGMLVALVMRIPWNVLVILGIGLVVSLPVILAADGMARRLLVRINWWGAPVIIIGHGSTVPNLVRRLKDEPALGWRPVAILDDYRSGTGTVAISGVPVVGGLEKAPDFTYLVRTALVAYPADQTHNLVALSERLPFPQVILVPELFGMHSLWVSACDIGGALGLQVRKELLIPRNRAIKLVLDYLLALPMALAAIPVIALCALWIKLVDRGPAFYAQEREGFRSRPIKVWKLRTMYADNKAILDRHLAANPAAQEEWKRFFKLRNDPRVLPGVGRILRRTSLDELPQLWNVLRGDISMVGPRPFPKYHLDSFTPAFRALRASVRPGLTGLWQVSSRSDGDVLVQEQQDTYYIRNWSIWIDLHIILRTASVVLRGTGAH